VLNLNKQGVRFGRDFALKFNQKPYINAGIFLDYIRTVFLPYIEIQVKCTQAVNWHGGLPIQRRESLANHHMAAGQLT
jgi:hypothetical protein